VRKSLKLDPLNLGPKIETYRNSWDAAVAHAIIDLEAEGRLLKERAGEWKYNEGYTDSLVKPSVDPNSLTAVGRAQKAVMDVLKELGDLRIEREALIELASERCGHARSTVDAAITKYSKYGEGYFELPMTGWVAVTAKGEQALDLEDYECEKRPMERHGQIKTAYPEEEVKVLLLYHSAISPYLSQKQRDLAKACAVTYTLDAKQVIGVHINDVRPFEKHCYEMLKKVKKDGFLSTPFGFGGAYQITPLGWRKLKTEGAVGRLTILGVEVPTETPVALREIPRPALNIIKEATPVPSVNALNGTDEKAEDLIDDSPPEPEINRLEQLPFLLTKESEPAPDIVDPLSEINALKSIVEILASIDKATQKRVLDWINKHYESK
jgi:hypothetical protein